MLKAGKRMTVYSPETIRTAKNLVPMDDVLFQKMCEDKAVCQEIISAILNQPITVEEVIPQDAIMNLQGRSVRLDCLCKLSDGIFANVEVQKSDDDDHEARVWYNASVITANETPKSVKFHDVSRVIVIFITRFDIFNGNLPIYHVDRVVRELNQTRNSRFSEIYVNAAAKNHDTELNKDVSDLMDLFTARETYNFERYPCFSKRKKEFSNSEKGELEMCEKLDNLVKLARMNDLFVYVQDGDMPLSKAAKRMNLTEKEFKAEMQKRGFTPPVRARKAARPAE